MHVPRLVCRRHFSSIAASTSWSKLPRVHHPSKLTSSAISDDSSRSKSSSSGGGLSDGVLHYLTGVMRLSRGDLFRAFNTKDGEFICRLTLGDTDTGASSSSFSRVRGGGSSRASKNRTLMSYDVLEKIRDSNSELLLPLVLFCAPIKKHRFKLVVEKAVELGISDIVPVITQNTNYRSLGSNFLSDEVSNDDYGGGGGSTSKSKIKSDSSNKRSLKPDEMDSGGIGKFIIECVEQSERFSIPTLHEPIELSELLNDSGDFEIIPKTRINKLIICSERGNNLRKQVNIIESGGDRSSSSSSSSDDISSSSSSSPNLPLLDILINNKSSYKSCCEDLMNLNNGDGRILQKWGILIGPEGGFTGDENAMFRDFKRRIEFEDEKHEEDDEVHLKHFMASNGTRGSRSRRSVDFASLGPNILRTETAAIASLGVFSAFSICNI